MILKKKKIKSEEKNHANINMLELQKSVENTNSRFANNIKGYKDLIYPSGIDVMNSEYIKIDGVYTTVLLCIDFPYSVSNGFLDDLINFDEGVEVCIYHEPQDKLTVIKDITHVLGFTKYKMAGGDNQIDSGLQENAAHHSAYMKKKLSEGDEFYYINMFVKITAESVDLMEEKTRRVEGELTGKNIFYRRADFRQPEAFVSTLPFNSIDARMKRQTEKNILSSGLAALYPFTASTLCDPEGMWIGYNNHDGSQIILDQFNTDNYPNANMTICGRTGIGKTYLTQMLAGRFRMQKIPTMLICPLKGYEYKAYCDNLDGNFIKFAAGEKNTINIMEIRPVKHIGQEKASYLADKLQRLQLAFSLMLPNITEDELGSIDAPLKKAYEKKGITMENASIYKQVSKDGTVMLKPIIKEMPTLKDAQEEIAKVPELKRIAEKMEPFVTGSLSFFNGQTNVDLDNLYTVADISDIQKNSLAFSMFVILDVFWDKIKMDRTQKKAVILDEVWKLIGTSGNAQVAEFVLEIFKIIRGYGGAAIATTQDIADFMMLEDGKYGKGIINASSIKIVLGLENLDAEKVVEILRLSEMEFSKITNFKKGEGILLAGTNHLAVNFKAFKTEEKLINTDRKKLLEFGEVI